ncbi:hypothetical protein B7P43_G15979 [Cryptotermes secundus]|uniref:Uncharacterized protein n=1 Tax=Cryptotermes secundus TaxID=105785 RepID=A0A2J7PGY9_9NEOP|nr:hypothetical protein B7P43_G15979 [Cryptotermes secundus]
MKRVAAKFVPRLLTAEQKQGRVEACCALKEESRNDQNFFSALSSISKDEFRQCFEKWNKRLDKCISVSGEYFEGD